jgi:hypothetical protein
MAKNSLPKTIAVTLDGVALTINQNGRIVGDMPTRTVAESLIAEGYVYRDGGMLFVHTDTLASAFGMA